MGSRWSPLIFSLTVAFAFVCLTALCFAGGFEKDGEQVQIDVRGPITLDEASLTRTAVLDGAGCGLPL